MSDEELQRRLKVHQDDFCEVRGDKFNHFFCPILHIDESVELCQGHVIPEALHTSNEWLPQRKDVDNFYGSMAEADFIAIVKDRLKHPAAILLDQESNRRHHPRIEYDGKVLEHYFPKKFIPVDGQTPAEIVGEGGGYIGHIMMKLTFEEMMNLDGKDLKIVVDRDYQPEVIASLLKTAHLTLFKLLGYQHVFSPGGILLADILRQFFLKYRSTPKNRLGGAVASYFMPYANMVVPLERGTSFQGTLTDNIILCCCGGSGRIFAIAVMVKALDDLFCVFISDDDAQALETYIGFLNEPPPSFAAKFARFVPADGHQQSRWQIQKEEAFRLQFPSLKRMQRVTR